MSLENRQSEIKRKYKSQVILLANVMPERHTDRGRQAEDREYLGGEGKMGDVGSAQSGTRRLTAAAVYSTEVARDDRYGPSLYT